jgi:hypothetical protein
MNGIKPPTTYDIDFYRYDSGFAGIDSSTIDKTYTITDESNEYSMTFIKELAKYSNESIKVGSKTCFLYEQWSVQASLTCFQDNQLVVYHNLDTKGNHQSIETIWKLSSIEYESDDTCRTIFCYVFKNGDCSTLKKYKERCLSIKDII